MEEGALAGAAAQETARPRPRRAARRSLSGPAKRSVTELVLAARRRDQWAFSELFNEYRLYAWAVAIRTTNNQSIAEDAVIDGFAATFRALDRLENPEAFRSYLATTVRRLAMAPSRSAREITTLEGADELMSSDDTPEESFETGADSGAALVAFRRLDDRQRNAVYLVDVEGSSTDAAAATMGLTAVGFRQLLSRARKNLRLNFIAPPIDDAVPQTCRACNDALANYVRGSAGPRIVASVEQHLAGCAACRARAETVRETNSLLTKARAAVPIGISAALLSRHGIDVTRKHRQGRRHVRHVRRGWAHFANMSHLTHLGVVLLVVAGGVGAAAAYRAEMPSAPAALHSVDTTIVSAGGESARVLPPVSVPVTPTGPAGQPASTSRPIRPGVAPAQRSNPLPVTLNPTTTTPTTAAANIPTGPSSTTVITTTTTTTIVLPTVGVASSMTPTGDGGYEASLVAYSPLSETLTGSTPVSGGSDPVLTFTGQLPSGVTFTASNGIGTFAGTPSTPGQYSGEVLITATGASPLTVPITITVTGTAIPAFTSPATATITLGQAFSFSITVEGNPEPTVSASVSGNPLPTGITLSFVGGVWVVSGTDNDASTVGQTYTVQGDATNAYGEVGQTLVLTVDS